jgi:hypothetical protein
MDKYDIRAIILIVIIAVFLICLSILGPDYEGGTYRP